MTTSNNTSGAADREQFISEQIEAAWDHVCLGFSANLLTLLVETRKRGLTDAEVKAYLQENESEHDEDFRGWRSGSGEPFLARNEGSFDTVASVNELFQELANQEPSEPDEESDDDSDFSRLLPADRIRAIVLKAAEDYDHVYYIMRKLTDACPELERASIAEVVQELIDAGTICISFDEEDWLAFFKCVGEGEAEDTEAIYFDALEAFTEAEKRWELHHGDLTEQEKHLLGIMKKIARSGVVQLSDLSEALRANNLTVESVWPLLELLVTRHAVLFYRRIGTSELYLELEDVRVDPVNQHVAMPELKKILDMNQRVEDRPRAFVLSKSIAAIGQALSPEECTVIDAAQTLHSAFHRGGGVRLAMLNRVLQQYHGMEKPVRTEVISSLEERGILALSVDDNAKIVRSVFRFTGPANNEAAVDNPGVGSLIVASEPPPTLRERCESLQYRQELSERFKLFAVCSIEAAMVLTAISERAGVDQTDFLKLFKHCAANGFTAQTFKVACEELSALDAIEIFRNRHSQLVVKVKRVVDSARLLRVSEAFNTLGNATPEPWFSTSAVAMLLQTDESRVQAMIAERDIPLHPLLKGLIPISSVAEMMAEC